MEDHETRLKRLRLRSWHRGIKEMDLILGADALEITLTDQGEKFPGIPQKREMKGDAIRFEDLPEGGFGWFLIHSLTQSIRYAFVDGKNVVRFEIDCA